MPYWRISGFYAFYYAILGIWMPFWPLYMHSIGYGAAAIGLCSAVFQGTRIAAPFLWGYISDRTGKRLRVIQLGCVLCFLSFFIIYINNELGTILLALGLYSFFWSAVLPQFEVITLEHLKDRPENYSRLRLWGSVGFIAASVGLGLYFDFQPIGHFLYWVSLILALMMLNSFFIPESDTAPHGRAPAANNVQPQQSVDGAFKPLLLRSSAIWFLLCVVLNQMSLGPYYGFYPLLTEQVGFSTTHLGLLWMVAVGAEIVLFWHAAKILKRFSIRHLLVAATLGGALRWSLYATVPDSVAVQIVGQLLHALVFALFHTVLIEYVRRLFAGTHHGFGQALFNALGYGIGSIIGIGGGGLLWELMQQQVFYLAALCSILATVCALLSTAGGASRSSR